MSSSSSLRCSLISSPRFCHRAARSQARFVMVKILSFTPELQSMLVEINECYVNNIHMFTQLVNMFLDHSNRIPDSTFLSPIWVDETEIFQFLLYWDGCSGRDKHGSDLLIIPISIFFGITGIYIRNHAITRFPHADEKAYQLTQLPSTDDRQTLIHFFVWIIVILQPLGVI